MTSLFTQVYKCVLANVLGPIQTVRFLLSTVVCDFEACCLGQEKKVDNSSFKHSDCGYKCHKVLKHVSKSYNIFRVVCNCREGVLRLI